MATLITLNISIPDADAPDVLAALKQRYALNIQSPSTAQVKADIEAQTRLLWAAWTIQYRRENAAVSAPVLS